MPVTPIATVPTDTNLYTIITQLNTVIGRWNNIGDYSDVTIIGGTIDGTPIGQTTPAFGAFNGLTATGTADFSTATSLVFSSGQINGDYVSGGTINGVYVVLTGDPTNLYDAATKNYVDTQIAAIPTVTWSTLTGKPTFATVATTGSYTDLINLPTLGSLAALSTVTTAFITDANVTYAKIQNVSAQYALLGRSGAGAGVVQEVQTSADVFTFLTQTSKANMLTTGLGLGTTSLVEFGSLGLGVASPAAGNLQVQKTATFQQELNNGTETANFNIDWTQAQKQSVVLGASALTMTFTNPLGPGHFQLKVRQDATGGRTKGTWPSILTPGGGASSWLLSSAANAEDILTLYYDGSKWYGRLSNTWSL